MKIKHGRRGFSDLDLSQGQELKWAHSAGCDDSELCHDPVEKHVTISQMNVLFETDVVTQFRVIQEWRHTSTTLGNKEIDAMEPFYSIVGLSKFGQHRFYLASHRNNSETRLFKSMDSALSVLQQFNAATYFPILTTPSDFY